MNTEHLASLYRLVDRERERLEKAKGQREIDLRTVWLSQIQKEIHSELSRMPKLEVDLSDDDLLAELDRGIS